MSQALRIPLLCQFMATSNLGTLSLMLSPNACASVTRIATLGLRPPITEPPASSRRGGLSVRDRARIAPGLSVLRGDLHRRRDRHGFHLEEAVLAVAGRLRLRGQLRWPGRLLIQLPGELVTRGVLPKAPRREKAKEKVRVKALVGLVPLPFRRGLRGQLRMPVAQLPVRRDPRGELRRSPAQQQPGPWRQLRGPRMQHRLRRMPLPRLPLMVQRSLRRILRHPATRTPLGLIRGVRPVRWRCGRQGSSVLKRAPAALLLRGAVRLRRGNLLRPTVL